MVRSYKILAVLTLLFSVKTMARCPKHKPMIAIVIDDIGRHPKEYKPFLDLRIPVTFAIFPCARYSRQSLKVLKDKGYEVLGHLPMEPLNRDKMEPDLEFLLIGDSSSVLVRKTERMISCLDGIAGVNNHMGSAFTAHKSLMEVILRVVKKHGLYFLDSRTTKDTKAYITAKKAGIPALAKDWFIDDRRDPEYVVAMLKRLAGIARTKGCAIGIGHPFKTTAEGIKRFLNDPSVKTLSFVPLSCLFSCHRVWGPGE